MLFDEFPTFSIKDVKVFTRVGVSIAMSNSQRVVPHGSPHLLVHEPCPVILPFAACHRTEGHPGRSHGFAPCIMREEMFFFSHMFFD